ncbi:ubiquitin thioesterase OTUB1 [Platysternon megacephalum]|uniref:Proton-coupled zinc antiporter SLC30A8 n=1 Tax=Platysternon megacephalum TaxID=55544 RepID=A0A4D9EPL7_9SAUR|nr:ubiquitin thioesterase OTUB1 [Platysternon megacephalum]
MATTKGLERTCLVADRGTKKYSLALDRMGLQQNNLNKEECQEESEDAEDNPLYHCHSHSMAYESRKIEQCQAKRKLYAASIICLIFMIAEIIGGQMSGSLAVITDAAHILVDLTSFLISLCSLWLSSKPSTKRLTFGWHRAEILGALMSMLIIWVVTGVLTYLASMRLLQPNYEIEATVMLITSGCAVIANVILSLTLHQTGPGHTHRAQANEHISALQQKPALANASVRAAFVHAIGDLFQSISVLISALIIFFKPEYKIADPVCTFVFSIFVLATTITILRDILLVLMEGTPKGFNYDAVRERILAVNKVESIHNLHLWSLTMNQVILSAHVVTEDTVDNHQILKEVTQILFDTYTFHSVTIQIEPQANQKPDCVFCQDPKD